MSEKVCEFCGQTILDGGECRCPGAVEKRDIERKIRNAKLAIKDMFCNTYGGEVVPPPDEAVELMNNCVELLAYEQIEKVTIFLPGNVKANLSLSKNSVKVERIETIKSSSES